MSVYERDSPVHLNSALLSIWDSQTVAPDEIILVQDGPLTNSIESVINHWQLKLNDRLKILDFEVNQGLGAALNFGLVACSFELVARMDADDLAAPDRFEKQLAFMFQNSDIDVLGSYVREMSYSGDLLQVRKSPVSQDEILSCLWSCPIVHPSVMLRRSRVLEVGNYDPRYRRRQDYELWFRCAEQGLRFHNLPESLVFYRFGQHTHKKQPPSLAWEQGMIGYRGCSRLGLALPQKLACFIPFLRSLLPAKLQHVAYNALKPLDPRRKEK